MAARDLGIAAALALSLASCDAGTGGRRVQFELAVGTSAPAEPRALRFRTGSGWDVTLEEACVAVGPIYLYENAGALAARKGLPARLYDALVPSAHAHAGSEHFNGGEVRGEWVGQIAVDLVGAATLDLGSVEGIAGRARSASVLLEPPRSVAVGDVACLRGHHAYAVGIAERDGVVVPFEGGLDIENEGTLRTVTGIPVDVDLDDGLRLALRVDPRAWFDQAQFDRLTEKSAAGRALVTPESQVRTAWFIGARGAAAFAVRLEPSP